MRTAVSRGFSLSAASNASRAAAGSPLRRQIWAKPEMAPKWRGSSSSVRAMAATLSRSRPARNSRVASLFQASA